MGDRTYGTMYGMHKTTVYLPDDLKRALTRVAAAKGQSEAELIREALRAAVAECAAPAPRLPLFASGKPRLAEQVDEGLEGFGEQ
jgi:plasmid stability protein